MSTTVPCPTCQKPVRITLMPRGMWEVADQDCDHEQDERAAEDAVERYRDDMDEHRAELRRWR